MSKYLNYGVIGNCSTAALISAKGAIEWLCFPDFYSASVFAAILDPEKGGSFGIETSGCYHTWQEYVPHTNILTTHFENEEGCFDVVDFMPIYALDGSDRYYRPSEIYRYIRLVSGKPRFKVNYQPAPNYARGETIYLIKEDYLETYSSSNSSDRQYLYSSLPLRSIALRKEIVLDKDEFFLLSYNEKTVIFRKPTPIWPWSIRPCCSVRKTNS